MNKIKTAFLLITLLGGIMISFAIKQDHAIAIPSPVTKWYDQKENVTEELSKEEDEIEEVGSLTEPEMSETFKVNENNPYAMYTETFSGGYLYDIYEANKGSEADGDWFEKESKKFTYHEQYDPLNNEHLNFEWDIKLSEMEGTDPLSEAFNNYHQQLFEEQKAIMEEHQKEVKEMEPEEIREDWLMIHFSNNIFSRASFKWGDIFTVVDMKNIHDRGCYPIIANFNSISGKQYQLDDLFSIDNYPEELIEIIRAKSGGSDMFWSVPLGCPDSLPFLIGYQGLLLFDGISEFSILFEWSDLEDILKPEIWEVINKGRNDPETAYHENGWKIEPDAPGDEAIGSNLFYNGWCTEGNRYIYTLNMAFYGEEQEDNDHNTIYRFDKSKNQWEIVVSYAMPPEEHLYDENGKIISDRYVWDLTYYKGYVYYILVNDYAPGEGLGKEYYFYRVSEQKGKVEKIGEGFDRFHIYNNKIYYKTYNHSDQKSYFCKMDINGTNQEIVGDSLSWVNGENFTVGGGSLYWVDENNSIRAMNLETKKEKIFAVNLYRISSIYYENGNLYIDAAFIYQLNLNSGDIKKIVETKTVATWIYNGFLYYVDYMTNKDQYNYYFWRRDLLSDEIIKWNEILIPRNANVLKTYVHLEAEGNNILFQVGIKYLSEHKYGSWEYSYFMKSIDEIE